MRLLFVVSETKLLACSYAVLVSKITTMKKYYYYLLISVLLTNCSLSADKKTQTNPSQKDIKKIIDNAANEFIKKPLIHGTSIGVFYRGQAYSGHYGVLEEEKQNKPSNATIYEIGSLSKVLTGTLVAQAVLEGKIKLEDKVDAYLDGNYSNLQFENHPVKIKHLLTHSGRFPNILPTSLAPLLTKDFLKHDSPAKINAILKTYTKNDFLEDLHKIHIDTIPGFKYAYSSAATELTAHILEQVYQEEFEVLLIKFLSEKIGMKSTKIRLNLNEKKLLAAGYHANNPEVTVPMGQLPWGAGGNVKTTVSDMLQFIQFELTKNDIVEESHKTLVEYNKTIGLSYFWQVHSGDEKLGKHYLHHGGVPRSQCFIYIIPEHNLGAFMITNQSGKATAKKLSTTLDKIFEGLLNPVDNKKSASTN